MTRQYKPVRFGDGPVAGSVDDVQRKRQQRAEDRGARRAEAAYFERYPERKEDDELQGWRRVLAWLRGAK